MPFNESWNATADPNITTIYSAFEYANTVTENLFGAGIIFSIFTILFVVFRRYGSFNAFAASSFITFVLSVMLRGTGLIDDMFVVIFGVMTAAAIIVMTSTR